VNSTVKGVGATKSVSATETTADCPGANSIDGMR
jgi:hypothetical protein